MRFNRQCKLEGFSLTLVYCLVPCLVVVVVPCLVGVVRCFVAGVVPCLVVGGSAVKRSRLHARPCLDL